ncbi:DUF6296 family protein [Streptomyces noboritoensis]|uniref:DUF6296 family protein n=1 Tax=Streptomyces noboritoensis TaxID=67337 RepID=A0ABV6TE87_9ACTN
MTPSSVRNVQTMILRMVRSLRRRVDRTIAGNSSAVLPAQHYGRTAADRTIVRAETSDSGEVRVLPSGGGQEPARPVRARALPS